MSDRKTKILEVLLEHEKSRLIDLKDDILIEKCKKNITYYENQLKKLK